MKRKKRSQKSSSKPNNTESWNQRGRSFKKGLQGGQREKGQTSHTQKSYVSVYSLAEAISVRGIKGKMSFKSQESGSIRCAPLIQVWKLIKRNKYDITGGNKSKLRLLFLFVCFFCLFICFFNMLRPVQIWRSRKGGKAKRIIEMLTKILRASSFALKEEGLRSRDNERHWISDLESVTRISYKSHSLAKAL